MTQSINVVVPPPINVTIGQGQGGARGPQGLQGIQGTTGTATSVAYRHTQGIPSSTWEIEHSLGFYPNVTVEDSTHNIVEGEIQYSSMNKVVLVFATSFSGYAYLS